MRDDFMAARLLIYLAAVNVALQLRGPARTSAYPGSVPLHWPTSP